MIYLDHHRRANDIVYELLAAYVRKSNGSGALDPLAHTPEAVDYHLSWHMLSTLLALGLAPTPRSRHYHLHYASQVPCPLSPHNLRSRALTV